MKQLLIVLFILAVVPVCLAITVDDVIQLSKLKTGDDLIIRIIQEGKLDQPTTPADVVRMKQEGVTDRVIELMLTHTFDKSIRTYTITNKNGKSMKVFTNLDENGQRMGGPAPEPAQAFPLPEAPQQVTVVVKHEAPAAEEEYAQEYAPSPYYSAYYGGGYGYDGYYPYAGAYLNHFGGGHGSDHHSAGPSGSIRDSTFPSRHRRTPMSSPAPAASFARTRSGGFHSN